MSLRVIAGVLVVAVTTSLPGCVDTQITREEAVAVALREVPFEPSRVEAVRAVSDGRPTWQVTFRGRLAGQPPGLFETMVVDVDAETGAVIAVSRT